MGHSAWHVDTAGMSYPSRHRWAKLRRLGIAAFAAGALTSGAHAAEAVVGRESHLSVRARVVDLVNVARSSSRRCGANRFAAAPPLSADRDLNDAAARHARDMARKKYFDHRGSDGSQPKERVMRAGYQPRLTGENIAFGPVSAEEVLAGWLASPGHCANIMDSRFQHIGVGLNTGSKRGQIYWVQTFGAPHH
ncbi:MAG TPA: CAP domain-containing protein [Steroidobacteraceae bacterium]|nr:CAP domain-containing protein [Steroidobacteraceae bacterium]